jgi:hypothetical protein
MADLDLPGGTRLIPRSLAPHTVYLDELTRALAIAWLRGTAPPLARHRQPPPADHSPD